MVDHEGFKVSSEPGLRDNADLYGQAGLATYVAAAIFGSPSMLRNTPEWLRASVESQANFAQRLLGTAEMTIGGANGGPLDMRTKEEREHDAADAAAEYLTGQVEQIERQREIERQHEAQWMTETHSYAGQTLSGSEWREMMSWFADPENTQGWEDAMMAETGESRAEVRRTGGKMKRFYDLMDKDAKGTLTKEERTEFTALQQDEDIRKGFEVQQQLQGLRTGRGYGQTADTDARLSGSQQESDAGRSDLYADESSPKQGLAAVEPLSPIHRKAADAVPASEPAAPPKPVTPIAANTVTVNPANMFG